MVKLHGFTNSKWLSNRMKYNGLDKTKLNQLYWLNYLEYDYNRNSYKHNQRKISHICSHNKRYKCNNYSNEDSGSYYSEDSNESDLKESNFDESDDEDDYEDDSVEGSEEGSEQDSEEGSGSGGSTEDRESNMTEGTTSGSMLNPPNISKQSVSGISKSKSLGSSSLHKTVSEEKSQEKKLSSMKKQSIDADQSEADNVDAGNYDNSIMSQICNHEFDLRQLTSGVNYTHNNSVFHRIARKIGLNGQDNKIAKAIQHNFIYNRHNMRNTYSECAYVNGKNFPQLVNRQGDGPAPTGKLVQRVPLTIHNRHFPYRQPPAVFRPRYTSDDQQSLISSHSTQPIKQQNISTVGTRRPLLRASESKNTRSGNLKFKPAAPSSFLSKSSSLTAQSPACRTSRMSICGDFTKTFRSNPHDVKSDYQRSLSVETLSNDDLASDFASTMRISAQPAVKIDKAQLELENKRPSHIDSETEALAVGGKTISLECPRCTYYGLSKVNYKIGNHAFMVITFMAMALVTLPFAWIPAVTTCTKDVIHSCPKCHFIMGIAHRTCTGYKMFWKYDTDTDRNYLKSKSDRKSNPGIEEEHSQLSESIRRASRRLSLVTASQIEPSSVNSPISGSFLKMSGQRFSTRTSISAKDLSKF